jgi:hypothetical protein
MSASFIDARSRKSPVGLPPLRAPVRGGISEGLLYRFTRIYQTTPVGHDAALMEFAAALRVSGVRLGPGEGLFERPQPGGSGMIAVTPRAYAALRPRLEASGLKAVHRRDAGTAEEWVKVDNDAPEEGG